MSKPGIHTPSFVPKGGSISGAFCTEVQPEKSQSFPLPLVGSGVAWIIVFVVFIPPRRVFCTRYSMFRVFASMFLGRYVWLHIFKQDTPSYLRACAGPLASERTFIFKTLVPHLKCHVLKEANLGGRIMTSKDRFNPPLPRSVTLFENSDFAHVPKLRWRILDWGGPHLMTAVLLRRRKNFSEMHRHTGDKKSRWEWLVYTPRAHSRLSRKNIWLHTVFSRSCERICAYHLKLPSLWSFLT